MRHAPFSNLARTLALAMACTACGPEAARPGFFVPTNPADAMVDSGAADAVTADGADDGSTAAGKLAVSVDNQAVTGAACSSFPVDQSSGQLKYLKKVSIKNTAPPISPSPDVKSTLCIHALKFTNANKQLKMVNVTGKTTDETTCPGAFAALAAGKSLYFEIEYKPDSDNVDLSPGTLTVETNDTKAPVFSQQFCIQAPGGAVCVDGQEIVFLNASAANPPVMCVYFANCGSAPLTYKGAQFSVANSQYTIVEAPDAGTVLPEVDHPENPKGNLKKLKVCIRYTPNSTVDDEDGKLEILTSDEATPKAYVILGAMTQIDSKRQWTCNSASGKLEFNFTGQASGVKEAKCKVCNEGPAGWAPTALAVHAYDPALAEADLAAIYKVSAFGSPSGEPSSGVFAVGAGKCADFVVTMTYPNIGTPPAARLDVSFMQANQGGIDSIPIVAGPCESGALALAPETGTWLQAASGGSAQGTVVVANQGCGPLQVIEACITAAGPGSGNPCASGSPSKYHGIVGGFSTKAMPAGALVPIQVEFHPPDASKLLVSDLLHVRYCSGKWQQDQCVGGSVVVRTVTLVGSTGTDVVLPGLALAGPETAKVGQPVKVTGVVTKGTLDGGADHSWWVVQRPFGSTPGTRSLLWLGAEFQPTGQPVQTFIPDLAGTYVIAAMAQAVDGTNAGVLGWTTPAFVTVVVK